MTYLDAAALATHRMFQSRVQTGMVRTAVNVAAEAPSGDSRLDSLRKTLATNVLNDPDAYAVRFSWAVVSNTTVAAEGLAATDGDLEFTISSVWNAVAGV